MTASTGATDSTRSARASVRAASSVIWPIAWPLLVAAGVRVMALSLTEVTAPLLISPERQEQRKTQAAPKLRPTAPEPRRLERVPQ